MAATSSSNRPQTQEAERSRPENNDRMDEVKPICGPCVKSHRPCEYDAAPASQISSSGRDDILSTRGQDPPQRAPAKSDSSAAAYPWPRRQPRSARVQNDDESHATEMGPVRWFGLLSADTAEIDLDVPSHCSTDGTTESGSRPDVMQVSTIAPSIAQDEAQERPSWQAQERLQLRGLEHDMYKYFVDTISVWIDIFDPAQHCATIVPRKALYNEGLLKAVLALGAKHLSAKTAPGSRHAMVFRHAAVQYYSETLQYLQSAMKYQTYKNSEEVLATTLIISAYEMIDGGGKGWERHLKGVFWIQRTREINGESGGLEQAVWWAWIHQDLWAAFQARRRCFSFFKPTRLYSQMDVWDKASRIVYILAQCVNFVSDEEKRNAVRDPSKRIARADELAKMLEDWYTNKGVSFDPLPFAKPSSSPIKPIWIHPPAFAISVQMYHVARILLVSHDRASRGGDQDIQERERDVSEDVDVVAGLATQMPNHALRAFATQYLFMAGLFCANAIRRKAILEVIDENAAQSDWPASLDYSNELKVAWFGSTASQQQRE